MKRVASVTPLAVVRDSRTYKHGASLARLGYESVVVEDKPSGPGVDAPPFELVSATAAGSAAEPAELGSPPATAPGRRLLPPRVVAMLPGPVERALRGLADGLLRAAEAPIALVRLLAMNLRAYRALPAADLYYLHSYSQYLAIGLKARRRRAPYIYDAHDSYFEVDQDPRAGYRTSMTPRMFSRIERVCVRRAAGFTTVSEGVAGMLERRHGRRPLVVRNCHDLRLDQDVERDVRAVAGVSPDAFLLVSVGNAKAGTTFAQMLEALTQLPDRVEMAFVGAGFEAAGARELGLEGRVHLLAPVEPTRVAAFIRRADAAPILYFPFTDNYRYSLPNGLFHAVAAGLPILYPPLVEIQRLAEEHSLGLPFDPRDPASIATAVGRLSDEPGLAAGLRENVERARAELSWEREEAVVAELVRSTLVRGADGGTR